MLIFFHEGQHTITYHMRYILAGGLIVAALFVFFGCSSVTWVKPRASGSWNLPREARVCLELPETQLVSAREAVGMWDRSLNLWKRFVPVSGKEILHGTCEYRVVEVIYKNVNDPEAIAWADDIGGSEISMRKGEYERDTTVILMHEMGHALGAQHVEWTLMHPVYDKARMTPCPDVVTVAQVAAWNNVEIELLGWCQR